MPPSMFDIARLIGDALREVKTRDGPYLMQNNIDSNANFIVGGQVRGEPPRLFEVYSEGNFIEATPDTCYFQIGESKYGKPVIDRVITRRTGLLEATKCTVVSFDSTMRSNISVGLPDRPCRLRNRHVESVKLQKRIEEIRSVLSDGPHTVGRGPAASVRGACRTRTGHELSVTNGIRESHCNTERPTTFDRLSTWGRMKSGCDRRRSAARRFSVIR